MARHTLSHAVDLYSGEAVMNGWLGSNRGLPIDLLILDDLGAPELRVKDSVALAATAGNQTTAQDANFVLDGGDATDGVVTFDVARGVEIVSSDGGDTSQKAIVTGTDKFGNALTESISFNGTTIVNGKKAFKKITQVQNTVAVMAGNVDIGKSDLIGLTYRVEQASDVVAIYEDGVLRSAKVAATAAPAAVTAVAMSATPAGSLVAAASTALSISMIDTNVPTNYDPVTNMDAQVSKAQGEAISAALSVLEDEVTGIELQTSAAKVDFDATKVEVDRLVVENDDVKVQVDLIVLENADAVVQIDKLVLDLAAQKVELDKLILDVDLGTVGTFAKADKTAATTTTGDVRGTYDPVQVQDGTKTLKLLIRPFSRTSIGAYGIAQA